MAGWKLVLPTILAFSCRGEHTPIITGALPLNRSTSVDTTVTPEVQAGAGAAVDASERRIVLFDVTGGARTTVRGTVAVQGRSIRYEPGEALTRGHEYELVLEAGSIRGEYLDDVDGSESPQELLSWPYRLAFTTGSGPRVRAVYLEQGRSILIRFSQPMNVLATQDAVQVLEPSGTAMELGPPAWTDDQSVRMPLGDALDPGALYTVSVGSEAMGADGTPLDGDADGESGEPEDGFSAQFTGSQPVIVSRLSGP